MIQNRFFIRKNYKKNLSFFKNSKKVLINFSNFLKNERFFDKSFKKNFKLQLFFLLSKPLPNRNIHVFKESKNIKSRLIQNRTNLKKPIDFFKISYKKNQLIKPLKNLNLSAIKSKNKVKIKYNLFMLMKNLNKNKVSKISVQKIINKLFFPIFEKFILLKTYQNYLKSQLIKNINNIPYAILIVYINRYTRFWKIFRMILSVFIFLSIVSTANFTLKIIKLISNQKLATNRHYRLINSKLWELKSDLFESKIKKYFTFLSKFSKKRAQPSLNKDFYLLTKDLHKLMLHFLHINNMYKFKLKDSKLLNIFFSSHVFSKSQSRSQKTLKSRLWKLHKKSHNQNSFKWVFKKYWLNINLYKKSARSGFITILKTQKLISLKNNLIGINFSELNHLELINLIFIEIFALLLKNKIKPLNFELKILSFLQLLKNNVRNNPPKKPTILYTYWINDLA